MSPLLKPLIQQPYRQMGHSMSRWWGNRTSSQKNGLLFTINLITALVKIGIFDKAYKSEGFSQRDRKILITQEGVRQFLSAVLWLTSSMTAMSYLRRSSPKNSSMEHFLISNLFASFVDAVIRPFLTVKISKWFLDRSAAKEIALSAAPKPGFVPQPQQWKPLPQPNYNRLNRLNSGYAHYPRLQTPIQSGYYW